MLALPGEVERFLPAYVERDEQAIRTGVNMSRIVPGVIVVPYGAKQGEVEQGREEQAIPRTEEGSAQANSFRQSRYLAPRKVATHAEH